jgi:hypothetical protein
MKLRDINQIGNISVEQTRRHFHIECNYTTEKRDQLFRQLESDDDIRAECCEEAFDQRKLMCMTIDNVGYFDEFDNAFYYL